MIITSVPFVLNRAGDFRAPQDGWIQLVPIGRVKAPLQVPGSEEEIEVLQVVDRMDAETLATKFRIQAAAPNFPGLLIDFDHFSHDKDKSTRAAGWIEEAEVRDDGLWGRVRFSATGKASVEGGDYRLFSPVLGYEARVYQPGEEVRPKILLRGALTNDPRFKGMVPLSNRQDSPAASKNRNTTMDYKSVLIGLLGLAAAATDAEIQAAADGKKTESENRKSELLAAQNRAATAEASLIEHDLDKAGLQGEARNAAKALLVKNRNEGLAFLVAIGKPESGYKVTHNRAAVPTSQTSKAASDDEARAARIANRATEIQRTEKISYSQAFSKAESEAPAATTAS